MNKRQFDKECKVIKNSFFGLVDIAYDDYDTVVNPAKVKLDIALTLAERERDMALDQLKWWRELEAGK